MNKLNKENFLISAKLILGEGSLIQDNVDAMAACIAYQKSDLCNLKEFVKQGICLNKFKIFNKLFNKINFFGMGLSSIEKISIVDTIEVEESLSFINRVTFTPEYTKILLTNKDELHILVESEKLVYCLQDLEVEIE